MLETLRGTIERITFHNEENGYTVAQLAPDGQSYTVTVIGAMLGINVGESVELGGAWMAHPQYGRQFKAESVRTILPATIAGLEKYLGSGLIKGIGPVTAKRIVRKFGLETLQVIEEKPQRLHEVLGVGRKRVDLITRAWAEQQKIKEVMLFLQSHSVSTGLAVKIYKAYGDDAIEIVRTIPTGWRATSSASASSPRIRSHGRSASRMTRPNGSRPASPTCSARRPTRGMSTCPRPS